MTKLLNLDELPTRADYTIVLNGKRHPMKPMSVGEFIRQQKLAESLKDNTSVAQEFGALVDVIHTAFPSMAREEIEGLSFERMNAIFAFLGEQGAPSEKDAKAGE